MSVTVRFRSGVATDPGLLRLRNEDRYWVDEDNGIFLVVDGVGGRAAGEQAAEIAVATIRDYLNTAEGPPETRVRGAIAAANNTIYRQARDCAEYRGMACVLTLAVLEEDRITIGHVGDSRLYLVWNGAIRKLTSDHSPVGEREDRAEISEEEAMDHPRRNEVFRDVGSMPHGPGDADFIETRQCLFRPEAAILLCSDGLTDLLTAAEIGEIVAGYDGDAGRTARELVDAANHAGGHDNITVIFVAGGDFLGRASALPGTARDRHSITRERAPRPGAPPPRDWTGGGVVYLVLGIVMGLLAGAALERYLRW